MLPKSFNSLPEDNLPFEIVPLFDEAKKRIPIDSPNAWNFAISDLKQPKIPLLFFSPISQESSLLGYNYHIAQIYQHPKSITDDIRYTVKLTKPLSVPSLSWIYTFNHDADLVIEKRALFGSDLLAAYAARNDIKPGKYLEHCQFTYLSEIKRNVYCEGRYEPHPTDKDAVVRDGSFQFLISEGDSLVESTIIAQAEYSRGTLKSLKWKNESQNIAYSIIYDKFGYGLIANAIPADYADPELKEFPIYCSLGLQKQDKEFYKVQIESLRNMGEKKLITKAPDYTLIMKSQERIGFSLLYSPSQGIWKIPDAKEKIPIPLGSFLEIQQKYYKREDPKAKHLTIDLICRCYQDKKLSGPHYFIRYYLDGQKLIRYDAAQVKFYLSDQEVDQLTYESYYLNKFDVILKIFIPEISSMVLDYLGDPEVICCQYIKRWQKQGPTISSTANVQYSFIGDRMVLNYES